MDHHNTVHTCKQHKKLFNSVMCLNCCVVIEQSEHCIVCTAWRVFKLVE